jgi:hypothetical protein
LQITNKILINLKGTVFFKKTYQDLVGYLEDFLNLLRSYMIFKELKRSCKDTRSCSIPQELEQEFAFGIFQNFALTSNLQSFELSADPAIIENF